MGGADGVVGSVVFHIGDDCILIVGACCVGEDGYHGCGKCEPLEGGDDLVFHCVCGLLRLLLAYALSPKGEYACSCVVGSAVGFEVFSAYLSCLDVASEHLTPYAEQGTCVFGAVTPCWANEWFGCCHRCLL